MADFYQTGVVATFHRFGRIELERMEFELAEFNRHNPIASPNMDYEFCKGYYARVTDRMHGRVTRLFVTPLIRSLVKLYGSLPLLVYLDSFRYPLAGEFSMIADLARINRIPGDWGLEVETLAEIYRNCSSKRICQVELCETYEHKHQPLSAENPKTG